MSSFKSSKEEIIDYYSLIYHKCDQSKKIETTDDSCLLDYQCDQNEEEEIKEYSSLPDYNIDGSEEPILFSDVSINQNQIFLNNIQEQIDQLLNGILKDFKRDHILTFSSSSFSLSKLQVLFSFCENPEILEYATDYFSLNWKTIIINSYSSFEKIKGIFLILDLFSMENPDPIQQTDFFSLFFTVKRHPEMYLLFISLVVRLSTKFSSPIFFFRDISYLICRDLSELFQSDQVDSFLSYLNVPTSDTPNEYDQDESNFDTSSPAYIYQENFLQFLMISLKKKTLKPKYFSSIINVLDPFLTDHLFFKDQKFSIQYSVISTLFSYNENFRPIIYHDYLEMIYSNLYDSSGCILQLTQFIIEQFTIQKENPTFDDENQIEDEELGMLIDILENCKNQVQNNKIYFDLLKSDEEALQRCNDNPKIMEKYDRLIQKYDPIKVREITSNDKSKYGFDPVTFKIVAKSMNPNEAFESFEQFQNKIQTLLGMNSI